MQLNPCHLGGLSPQASNSQSTVELSIVITPRCLQVDCCRSHVIFCIFLIYLDLKNQIKAHTRIGCNAGIQFSDSSQTWLFGERSSLFVECKTWHQRVDYTILTEGTVLCL